MRLALLSSLSWCTPPKHYGPRERLTSLLCEGLIARGMEVTLFATADSQTSGQLTAVCPEPLGNVCDTDAWLREASYTSHLGTRELEFDLMHNVGNVVPLIYSDFARTPMVTTVFDAPSPQQLPLYRHRTTGCYFVAPSAASRSGYIDYMATIHPGVDLARLPYSDTPGTYLVFCGRMHPDEDVSTAIEIARQAALPLILVGPKTDPAYFETDVAPWLEQGSVTYVGEAESEACYKLLAEAYALLIPGQKAKPFSLSAIEAMACGTPVLARDAGAMREIVIDGVTGFLAESVEQAIAKLDGIAALSRERCRQVVTDHYNCDRMVSEYVTIYERILEREKPHAQHAAPPWGRWEVLLDEPTYKVKRITVLPDKRLSYQKHFKREEHWIIVEGKAMVTLDGRDILLLAGETVDIPLQAAHRIANPGPDRLVFIEVQRGTYFGEDDIIRLQDDYGRTG